MLMNSWFKWKLIIQTPSNGAVKIKTLLAWGQVFVVSNNLVSDIIVHYHSPYV